MADLNLKFDPASIGAIMTSLSKIIELRLQFLGMLPEPEKTDLLRALAKIEINGANFWVDPLGYISEKLHIPTPTA